MYAVIESGNKQYRVELGTEIQVDRLDVQPGDAITLDRVLLVADGDDTAIGQPVVDGARVSAEVLGQDRGEKVVVFKYKPKARRRVKKGFRAELTTLRISDISFAGRSAARDAEKVEAERAKDAKAAQKAATQKAAADKELAAKLAATEAPATEEAAAPPAESSETAEAPALDEVSPGPEAQTESEAPAAPEAAEASADDTRAGADETADGASGDAQPATDDKKDE